MKNRRFSNNRLYRYISETVQATAIVTIEDE